MTITRTDPALCLVHVTNGRSVRRVPEVLLAEHRGDIAAAWAAVPGWRRARAWKARDHAARAEAFLHREAWTASAVARLTAEPAPG